MAASLGDGEDDRAEFLRWLASVSPGERDRALEARWGIQDEDAHDPPGDELIGYHPSGVAAIARAILDAPIGTDDVMVDLGAGLGKVCLMVSRLTGALSRGIEIQSQLVSRAQVAADRLGLDVEFVLGDARTVDDSELADGTVFFLYLPFTGSALREVLARLRKIAERRAIVVCALGVELAALASWLVPRPSTSFWLSVYESEVRGVPPRARIAGPPGATRTLLEAIAAS